MQSILGRLLRSTAIKLVAVSACVSVNAPTAAQQQSVETYTYDALGRLVRVEVSGGQNNGDKHSICYDKAGNRTAYKASADGSLATCAVGSPTPTPTPAPTPTPTPTPTPAPSNSPPNAVNDLVSGNCNGWTLVNLTVNDTDPEPNYPLSLVSLSAGSGGDSNASIASSSSVEVFFGPTAWAVTTFTYTVQDSLGATDTGSLSVSTGSCSGGPPPD